MKTTASLKWNKTPDDTDAPRIVMKVFYSHSYRATPINIHFFNLFNNYAEVQFEVDEGLSRTNVARLEKMIRGCDAFIGVYPFVGKNDEEATPKALFDYSQYFRFELDIAIRSGKPAIIFYDKRYVGLFNLPESIYALGYDENEIKIAGGFPSGSRFMKLFEDFSIEVKIRKELELHTLPNRKREKIAGIIMPANLKGTNGYTTNAIKIVKSILADNLYTDIQIFEWPFSLDAGKYKLLQNLDLAVVELNGTTQASGIFSFLHARCIPTIRTHFNKDKEISNSVKPTIDLLYAGMQVGYKKDLLIWDNIDTLKEGMIEKLDIIRAPVKRFKTHPQAIEYFQSAARRKEAVFLSYSHEDADKAKEIGDMLKQVFQKVFDYKDRDLLEAGDPWLKQIFEHLSNSSIGISLLSQGYNKSGNCEHEAMEMVAMSDLGKLKHYPVKLYNDDKIIIPSYIRTKQYYRYYEYDDAQSLVQALVENFDRNKKS